MITWKIKAMESTPDTGVVVSAMWACIGEQDGNTTETTGTSMFLPASSPFTPYDNLTQDQVLNWVWTDGGVDKQATESATNLALQAQVNPPVVIKPLPWE